MPYVRVHDVKQATDVEWLTCALDVHVVSSERVTHAQIGDGLVEARRVALVALPHAALNEEVFLVLALLVQLHHRHLLRRRVDVSAV